MNKESKKKQWEKYCAQQLAKVTPLLYDEGFVLEKEQPHLQGERYVLSGKKLVLYGARREDSKQVVIKITENASQATALQEERDAKNVLQAVRFAYQTFKAPKEILFGYQAPYTFYITEYIPQEKPFLSHTLEEQFFFALKAFEAQESFHITTKKHFDAVKGVFPLLTSLEYVDTFTHYRDVLQTYDKNIGAHFDDALTLLKTKTALLDRYSGFLTHWDFVPHNLRVHRGDIYLLDHTAIRFGNKYEGWARFLNFMTLYNRKLEQALMQYVTDNRSEDERETLRLMRIYRVGELIRFYVQKLNTAEGDLHALTQERITFWSKLLDALVKETPLDQSVIDAYKTKRDSLRDEEEKRRQKNLH